MLVTPAYIFTILLGLWIFSIAGCIALSVFCYRLILDRGKLLLRLERIQAQPVVPQVGGLAQGAFLSDVALPLLSSSTDQPQEVVSLSHVVTSTSREQLLVFLDSDCLYSRALVRELQTSTPLPESPGIIAVIGGDPPSELPFFDPFSTLLHDPHRQAAPLYGVTATPAGYLVTNTRHTASTLQVGPAALLHTARTGSAEDQPRLPLAVTPIPRNADLRLPPLSNGEAAPDAYLDTEDGSLWTLAHQLGGTITLLFIDPDCPPCREILAQFADRSCAGMVIISQGAPQDPVNQMAADLPGAMLLLQPRREVAHAFRMLEAPAVYEIDAAGMISAGPIIGLDRLTRYLDDGICRGSPPGTTTM
ncbi:MAG: redoxin domain-containing protein [Thermomicrobiales bacterium]|nr:redoxin domain-containing protein [Thermomicrobiales bacterium]